MRSRPILNFSLLNRIRLLRYILAKHLTFSVSRGLRMTYDFLRFLQEEKIEVCKKNGLLGFYYPIENTKYQFWISEDNSDVAVFKQIILVDKEYEPIVALLKHNNIAPKCIIDGGANVGYTSIYLSHFFPGSKIFSYEPNPKTYSRMVVNVSQVANIVPFQKGIWREHEYLTPDYSFRDRLSWSFRLKESKEKTADAIEVIGMNEVIQQNNIQEIDLLKLDIEGGEKELFEGEVDWLQITKVIAVEIHSEFKCRANIETILKNHHFELSYSGELTVGVNRKLVPGSTVS